MSEQKKKVSALTITIIVLVLMSCCCVFTLGTGIGGYLLYKNIPDSLLNSSSPDIDFDGFGLPSDSATKTPTPIIKTPGKEINLDTLRAVEDEVVPGNDPLELACRLQGKCNIPLTLPSGPYSVGAQQKFWLTNTDTVESFQIEATLEYKTDHAYFWVEDGVEFEMDDAKALVDSFEKQMYPTNREFFGSEANPGVDEDQHIYIVYGRGIGSSVAGYFSSPDQYHPDAHEYSNAHEMFVFNADNSPLDDEYTYGVLAHEFQHMIHFVNDRNEESWVNEGFSELAVQLNGLYNGGADTLYISNPDMQLNDWGPDPGSNGPHYGASFLFFSYFLDRFGEDATKAVVADKQNGFESIDNVLASLNITDPETGESVTSEDVFVDWTITNYLLDESVADGRYEYQGYQNPMKVGNLNYLTDCPNGISGDVHQFGADYIQVICNSNSTLVFDGDTTTTLLPTDSFSGKKAFWSNKGDESNNTLTQEFDLSSVSGEASLEFMTWFDLEQDYDYLYVEASTDGGESWQILTTPSGTDEDPSGNSYGWGYNGTSGGWIKESVDISAYAGQTVLLRFEYITDAAVNGEGLLLDDISIPQIGYFSDLESDEGGWIGEGFINVANVLPQTFRVTVIDENGETEVIPVVLDENQHAEVELDLSNAVVVISGTTRHTRSLANYTLTIR